MSRKWLSISLGALLHFGAAASMANESPVPNADYGVSTIWPLGGPAPVRCLDHVHPIPPG